MNNIIEYLDELFPNPKCELNYNKDYELLIAVMLSAQTTDKKVNMVTSKLFNKYPSLESIVCASTSDIANIIKPLGTFNKKAIYIKEIADSLIKNYNGIVPNDRFYLESLKGVGRKTTNVVLSNLYNENCIAVDTHVARVSIRFGLAKVDDDVKAIEKKLNKFFNYKNLGRLHYQLVLFGRYYCKAKNPSCSTCKLKNMCDYYKNNNNN